MSDSGTGVMGRGRGGRGGSGGRGVYRGWWARHYDAIWRVYTRRTHDAALALIDWDALRAIPARLGRPPRVLDAGCGTGMFLARVRARLPDAELHGVDPSPDMLAQARRALDGNMGGEGSGDENAGGQVHLALAALGASATADLPFAPATFDLIACTNVLHALPDPAAVLAGLRRLLAPHGQLALTDFARRGPPFPWPAFAWLVGRIEGTRVRACTTAEARELCVRAGLRVERSETIVVDWLWRAWAARAVRAVERIVEEARTLEQDWEVGHRHERSGRERRSQLCVDTDRRDGQDRRCPCCSA